MTLTITWTDSDGGQLELLGGSDGVEVLRGALGIDAPPNANNIAPYVSLDGGVLTKRRRAVRPIVLPLLIQDATRVQTDVATVAKALQGPGALTIADGTTTRTLYEVIYEAGLEGDRSSTMAVGTWRKFVVSLIALDPWWQDAQQAEDIDTGSIGFDDSSTAFDAEVDSDGRTETTFTVEGDTTAQPVWTIDGPYSKLAVGTQGGQSFELAAALADGDQIVIDTRPGNRGPRLNGGSIDWSLLTPSSRLWELPVGSPVVVAGAAGDDAGSAVSVAFRQRWLTT